MFWYGRIFSLEFNWYSLLCLKINKYLGDDQRSESDGLHVLVVIKVVWLWFGHQWKVDFWNCVDALRLDLSIKECKRLVGYVFECQISDLRL